MLPALIAVVLAPQIQRSETIFEVTSVPADGGSAKVVGESKIATMMSMTRGRNIVWSYTSSESKSGWRKEWTYDEKGELTFQSYEVSFGDLKSRWNLARQDGKWNLTGSTQAVMPKKTGRIYDESVLWFVEKKAHPGKRSRISAIDTGTFESRNGEAKFLRTERLNVAGGVDAKVIEKKFSDAIEVWYVGDRGEVWRIDLVYPNANANLVFSAKGAE